MEKSLKARCEEVRAKIEEPALKLVRPFAQNYMDQFYLVKFRAKTVASIASKFARKKRRGDEIGHPKELTDLLGIRVVTTFRSELPSALQMVLNCVNGQDSHPYNQAPFIKHSVDEVIFYDSEKDGVDPSSIHDRLGPILEIFDVSRVYKRKQSKREYSSIHVLCSADPVDNYWPKGGVPVEIQIRTIFEDAWCEIDHKYNYQLVRDKADGAHEQQIHAVHLPTFRLVQALRTQQDAAVRIADQIFLIGEEQTRRKKPNKRRPSS
jgi:ppGpp synthetase/RelA/SpoT-type nucleotidyltranferase